MNQQKVSISCGNSKLGDVPNVSLIPGQDCGDVPCKRECYAMKAWRLYPNVRQAWQTNSAMAHQNRDAYFTAIEGFLAHHQPTYFRWHAAGDILDQDYLANMIRIAQAFPAIHFLCFTKRHDLDFTGLPDNLAVVFSMWRGWGDVAKARALGLGVAWMDDGTDPRIPPDAIKCPGGCDTCAKCWNLPRLGRDVVFKKH